MVNNICYTNCYYCYADKRRKVTCSIPLDRIVELIHEAKQLNVRTFDVIGGEFFLFKNWDKVLSELHKCGYHPYLSTKLPLNEPVVKKLAKMQIQDIQVSLDSLIAEHLTRSLDVKIDYIQKIKETITLLDKYNISIYIHTVLSKETESIEDIQSIYEFIKDVKNIAEWKIDKAGKSLYANTDYSKIEVNTTAVDKIATYIGTIEDHAPFPIRAPRPMTANQLIACGNVAAITAFGQKSFNHGEILILHNAIDVERFSYNKKTREDLRLKLGLDDAILIGHIGRFETDQKNQEFLIEVFERAKKSIPKLKLIFIGDGKNKQVLEGEISALGLADDVIFCGTVNNVYDYLQAMDIFCFPSITKNEAFGLALAEGMYFGHPAVTFTIEGSGVNYVSLNGQTGIECPNGDADAYAEALKTLANDEDLRKKYGEAAKARVIENFTFATFKKNIRDLVEGL